MSVVSEINRINTNIANAYSKCNEKGATMPQTQNSANLANTIDSISTGGQPVVEKDVNFYDYDGTLLYSYTKTEFLALESMPTNPTHEGLTNEGWTYSLADAKTFVNNYDELDLGQMYTTTDGKTHVYITLDERLSPTISFAINGTATIEWGDGTSNTVVGSDTTTLINTQHTYSSGGDYEIKINGAINIYGTSNYSEFVWNNDTTTTKNYVYLTCVKKIEFASNVNLGEYGFSNCYSLENVIFSKGITTTSRYSFSNCYSLKAVVFPNTMSSLGEYSFRDSNISVIVLSNSITIGQQAFQNCRIKKIIIPISNINNAAFRNNYSLQYVVFTSSTISSGGNIFYGCYSLKTVKMLQDTLTLTGSGLFAVCYSLTKLKIPNMASIPNNTFANCTSMKYYDFTNNTTVPVLSSNNVFTGIPSDCKIIVPDALYNSWISADYWNSLTSNIIRKSDWDALNS